MTIERTVKACWFSGTRTEELKPGYQHEISISFQEVMSPDLIPNQRPGGLSEPFLVSRALTVETGDRLRISIFEADFDLKSDAERHKETVLEGDEINKRQDLLKIGGVFERIIGRKVTFSWRPG